MLNLSVFQGRLAALVLSAGFSSSAFAAAEPVGLDLATTVGSLLLVVMVILAMAWMLKRMRMPQLGSQNDFTIVRQLALGTKERLVVIQAGEEQFVVGVTSQQIQLISKLETPLTVSNSAPFASQLNQLLKTKPSTQRESV